MKSLSLALTVPTEAAGGATRASPNVPLHHWTYDALEQLATEGWLERRWLDHRPLTRWEVAQAVATLIPKTQEMSPVLQKLLRDLEEAFRGDGMTPSLRDVERNRRTPSVSLSYAQGEVLLMGATSDVQPNVDTYVPLLFKQGVNVGLEGAAGIQITRVEANVSSLSKGGERIWEDMRSLWQTGVSEVNQAGELGIIYWPTDGLKLYAATAGDDFWAVGPARRIIPWGRKSGYLVGMYASDLWGDGRMDGRWEFTRFVEEQGDNWYTHNVPYLYDGWVIGHPAGHSMYGRVSNERDLFLRTTYRGRGATLGVTVHRAWAELPPEGEVGRKKEEGTIALDLKVHRGIWEVGVKAILLTEHVRGERRTEGRWILHLQRRVKGKRQKATVEEEKKRDVQARLFIFLFETVR